MIVEVLGSNIKINSYLENHSDKVGHHKYPFLRITDFIEIRALIGLIFFSWSWDCITIKLTYYFLQNLAIQYLEQQWDVIVLNFYSTIVCLMMWRHDEVDWQQDRFTTIREFFEIFNRNCMKHVIPSEYLSIDETLYPMRTQVRIKKI